MSNTNKISLIFIIISILLFAIGYKSNVISLILLSFHVSILSIIFKVSKIK